MAGAANRCVIPEHRFRIEHLTELLVRDRLASPSCYSVALVSEGATFAEGGMVFEKEEQDPYGHRKLGGIGDRISEQITALSARFNKGRKVSVISQRLGYLVRCGNPDAIDSIAPMAFGNLALNLILNRSHGRLVSLRNGRYDDVPLDVVVSFKKVVDIEKYYNTDRLRPYYESFESKPLFIMTSDY
jgi:6-phosphofructokinase 1